jgi:PAS domain S-box-containing protein
MNKTFNTDQSLPSGVLFLLLLGAGILGNYWNVSLFAGVDFLFGSIFTLLIVCRFGVVAGVLSALAASSYTYLLWNHPYAIVIFTLEALVIGLLYHGKSRNLLLMGVIFWILLGIPLVWIFYGLLLDMPGYATVLIMLKQSVNGIFNALVAHIILLLPVLFRVRAVTFARRPFSFYEGLFILVVVMVFVPTLVITMVNNRREMYELENEASRRLKGVNSNVAEHLSSWYERHHRAIEQMAGYWEREYDTGALFWHAEILRGVFPDFHAVFLTDPEGAAYVFDPPELQGRGEATDSDRAYFKKAKEKVPWISDVFISPGVVTNAIQVASVPLLKNGEFLGLAGGALNLGYIEQVLSSISEGWNADIVLLDRQHHIIASTIREYESLQLFSLLQQSPARYRPGFFLWQPEDPSLPRMTRWNQSFYAEEMSFGPGFHWTVLSRVPVAPYQRGLYRVYTENLAVALGLAILAIPLAMYVGMRFTRTLHQLNATTTDLPGKIGQPGAVRWPTSSVQEVSSLIGNFRSVVEILKSNFHTLEERTEALGRTNTQLQLEVQERQLAQEWLRESEEKKTAILETALDAVIIFDQNGRIRECNAAAERTFGFSRQMAGNQNISDLLAFTNPEELLSQSEGRLIETSALTAQGEHLPVELAVTRVCTTQETLFTAFVRDISGRKKAEEEIKSLNQELERRVQDRTASLQETTEQLEAFSYTVAHDLRAPLRSMQGFAQALQEDYGSRLDKAGRDYLSRISKSAARMDQLIQDLLAYARLSRQELIFEKIDLNYLLDQVSAGFSEQMELQQGKLEIQEPLPPVLGHWQTIISIFDNLISNALKFTRNGVPPRILIYPENQGGFVRIWVEDNGIGVPPEQVTRIFKVFERLNPDVPGTGIGLALVAKGIERMGGKAGVMPVPGGGSRFWIELRSC